MLSTQGCSFKGRDEKTYFPPRRLELTCFALSVWLETVLAPDPPPDPYHKFASSQSVEPIFMDFTRSFDVMSDVYLALFLKEIMYTLLCTQD